MRLGAPDEDVGTRQRPGAYAVSSAESAHCKAKAPANTFFPKWLKVLFFFWRPVRADLRAIRIKWPLRPWPTPPLQRLKRHEQGTDRIGLLVGTARREGNLPSCANCANMQT